MTADKKPLGYDDTPYLPDSKWRVHDSYRPQPRIVTPPTASTPQQPGQVPSDAVVLFDGRDLSGWVDHKGKPAAWKVANGYMEVVPSTGDIQTKKHYGDGQFHVEWAPPAEVKGESQGRGNSGVFLMDVYEIQVLDCYDNPTYADGMTAAIYGQYPPLVNACRPPGEWQSYDIIWFVPRFEGGKLVQPAYLTLLHNGILVHHNKALLGPTGHQMLPAYKSHPAQGPLKLQDHGDLVRYRNIWFRPFTDYDEVTG